MLKVIIADDEEKTRKLIKQSLPLKQLRLEVCATASDGFEALEMIKKHDPDILITDIRMPDCDGLTLIARARELKPELEIIIISGYAHFECARAAINYGISSYLLKPVNKQQLFDALEKCSEKSRKRRSVNLEREQLLTREGDLVRLRRSLIRDLIDRQTGAVTNKKLDKIYHFHVRNNDAVGVVIMKVCCTRSLSQNEVVIYENNLINKFRRAAEGLCHDLIIERFNEKVYAVASFPFPCCEQIKQAVVSFQQGEQAGDKLCERQICAALGSAEEAEALAVSFRRAEETLPEHLITGKGGVFTELLPESGLLSHTVLERYISDIMHAVDVLSFDAAASAADLLEKSAMLVPNLRGREAMKLVKSAASILTSAFSWHSSDMILENFFNKCERCCSCHQLFSCLRDFQSDFIKRMREDAVSEESGPVRLAKQYIRENYQRNINLEDVAKFIGFSGSYFSTLFKKETGLGFNQYLIDVRMEKAKELLKGSDNTVTRVCHMVGYSDIKHFNLVFKRSVGMTPGEYRKIHRQNSGITIYSKAIL